MRNYPGIITCQEEQKISKITTSKHNIFKEQKVLSTDPEKPSSKHISFLTGGEPGIPDRGVAVPEPVRKQVYKENQHMENVLPDSMNDTERKPSVSKLESFADSLTLLRFHAGRVCSFRLTTHVFHNCSPNPTGITCFSN
jgi:hypothetical protein